MTESADPSSAVESMDTFGQTIPETIPSETPAPLPEPTRTGTAVAIRGLFALGCVYGLYFAREVLMPIAIAILLAFLFSPAVDYLAKQVEAGVEAVQGDAVMNDP